MPQTAAKSGIEKQTERPQRRGRGGTRLMAYLLGAAVGGALGAVAFYLISLVESLTEPFELYAQEYPAGTVLLFFAFVIAGILFGVGTVWRFWPKNP